MDRWSIVAPALLVAKRRFIAGTHRDDALAVCQRLPEGITPILNYLGEHLTCRRDIEDATKEYLLLMDALQRSCSARELHSGRISLKLSQLGLIPLPAILNEIVPAHIPDARDALARELARTYQKTGTAIEIDMEEYDGIDETFAFAEAIRAHNPSACWPRIAIQVRYFRSEHDIRRAIHKGIPVRLVKGAYKGTSDIAVQSKRDIRERYLAYARLLLKADVDPAFGTHDFSLVKAIIEEAKLHRIPPQRFEFQMIHGLRPKLQKRLLEKKYRVARYIPYGDQWRDYCIRRWKFFLRNPLELYAYLYR